MFNMLTFLHIDETLLAVDKPAGLLAVPGRGPEKQDCLHRRVLERFPDALVVHRLDMETSGLVLFARSPEAQRALCAGFEHREIEKTYIAIVEGRLESENGLIDFPLRKDMAYRLPPRHVVDCVRGKKAITRWQVLERMDAATRVALYPLTGRSHQLRLHLQAIGHPIIGDAIYGTPAERLMLHAQHLELRHPQTGARLVLDCPAPF